MKREVHKSKYSRMGDKPCSVFIDYDRTVPRDMAHIIARERYAWPGGYELAAIMDDGGLVCSGCVRDEWRQVIEDTKTSCHTGWCVVAMTNESELEDANCSHCNKPMGYTTSDA